MKRGEVGRCDSRRFALSFFLLLCLSCSPFLSSSPFPQPAQICTYQRESATRMRRPPSLPCCSSLFQFISQFPSLLLLFLCVWSPLFLSSVVVRGGPSLPHHLTSEKRWCVGRVCYREPDSPSVQLVRYQTREGSLFGTVDQRWSSIELKKTKNTTTTDLLFHRFHFATIET